jgi:glycosyltransferase involved in cell wall biosynthesis
MLIEAWKPIWGGGQAHVWELANKLVLNHNCNVDIFVMNLDNKKKESYHKGKLNIYKIGKKSNFNSFKDRLKWCSLVKKEIIKRYKQKKYDIIHAHANLPGLPAKKVSKKLKIPIVYTIHGSGEKAIKDMYGDKIKSKILAKFENYLHTKIKYSQEITVDSSVLKLKNVNKPIVIPNGVNIKEYDKVKAVKSKKFKIVFLGRLHPQKGIKYLIESASLIKPLLKQKKVEFHLIGKGELDKQLKQLAKNKHVSEFFKFRGAVYGNNKIKELKSSHLFVLPSLYEGQPLTLLEAWASKLPVLVTDVGGNKDFVKKGVNGYLIPPKNIRLLSQHLSNLIKTDKKTLNKMGLNGYNLVKNNYTWDKVAEKTYKVYQKVKNAK